MRARVSRRWPLLALLASFVTAVGMLPLATSASAQGTWTVTVTGTSGLTTTGIVVNGSVTPNSEAGFAQVLYEPSGTPITSGSPSAGEVIFDAGETTPQAVSLTVDQLSPNTSYVFELEAIENDNDSMYFSAQGNFTTPPAPTGSGTPIDPPNDPSSNGIFGQCSSDPDCVNDMNGVRAAQENHSPVSLPTNWSNLSGAEQLFVWTNLERTSRGEVAITNLVNTYSAAVQAGVTNDQDPSLSDLPGTSGSIWAGGFNTVLGAMYGWLYDDGPGGENEDCTGTDTSGCWGHRDNILANPSNFGSNPTEMDAEAGTDGSGSAGYAAIFVANPNPPAPGNTLLSWAEEQPFLAGSTTPAPSISGITLGGTPAAPTVTVTGSNFGSQAPATSPETCQSGDTGNIFSGSGLVFLDVTEGWGSGQAGDCIGLILTSWSNTSVVFSIGSQYANYGPISVGDQIEVTIDGGATDTVTASFSTGSVPTVTSVSPTFGTTAGGTTVTITGTNFTGATKVVFGAVAATSFTVVSSTKITAVTPAEAAGLHNTEVTTASGTSAAVEADYYTFVAAPTVTGISPNAGTSAGGTTVTITGTGFTGATKVVFGAVAATSFTVVSSTKITAVTPAEAAGLHNTEVTTPNGTSAAVEADYYTFVGASTVPTVSSVSPNSGTTAGGTTVTITGTNFTGATKVVFGAVAATSFTVVSSTKITAVTPAEAAGLHNTEVTTPNGTSAAVEGDYYTFH